VHGNRGIIGRIPPALRVLAVAAILLLAGPAASSAYAVSFSVSPTQIVLAGRTRSALLTIRNESTDVLRFQLSAFAWDQSPTGEVQLKPTDDIVFFPALFTLQPGEERRIRVGTPLTAVNQREQTYRIFVEELPPVSAATEKPSGVRVLTRMGIPIFLRPAKETASATLDTLAMRDGKLSFTLANTGAVHFIPRRITARGLDAAGKTVFEESINGWYVLAGGRREFAVAAPPGACEQVAVLAIEAELPFSTLTERLERAPGVCRP
jgi:fimbrial chaperone protein